MKLILLNLLFSFSVHAATFKSLKSSELASKPLVSMMNELSLLENIEDTGVQALKIFSNGNQSLESIVRQNDHINGADGTFAKVVISNNAELSAASLVKGFLESLVRENDEKVRNQIQKKLTSVFKKALTLKNLVVLDGGSSFANGDANYTVTTIIDTTTMEMVQIHTGYAE